MFAWRATRARDQSHYLLLRRGVVPHETIGDTDANRSGFALLRLRKRLSARKLRVLVILAVAAAAAHHSRGRRCGGSRIGAVAAAAAPSGCALRSESSGHWIVVGDSRSPLRRLPLA